MADNRPALGEKGRIRDRPIADRACSRPASILL
jgi:hypothetical protein